METDEMCFGKLDEVFPDGAAGLREVPVRCAGCRVKTECLRAALASEEGILLRQRRLERSGGGGLVGRVRRWSELKSLASERDRIRKGEV